MPGIEESASALPGGGPPSPSRRSVLRGAAGAGAAGLAVTVLGGAAFPAAASAGSRADDGPAHAARRDPAGELVVHVRDARTGEIDLYHGTSHTRLHDRGLAAQLLRASQ